MTAAPRPEFVPALQRPGVDSQVLDYPSAISSATPTVALVRGQGSGDNACIIPTSDPTEAQRVLDGIILDKRLVTVVRTSALPAEFVRHVSEARQLYWELILGLKQKWVAAGSKITPEIAREVSAARTLFKTQVRSRFPVVGIPAKMIDVARGGYSDYQAVLQADIAAKIRTGRSAEVIGSAFRSNAVVDKVAAIATASRPVFKALNVAGVVVAAVEVPVHMSAMLNAKTDEEYDKAFAGLANASASGALLAACMFFTVGTGGLGLLACGIAPVAAGLYAGDAALAVKALMD